MFPLSEPIKVSGPLKVRDSTFAPYPGASPTDRVFEVGDTDLFDLLQPLNGKRVEVTVRVLDKP